MKIIAAWDTSTGQNVPIKANEISYKEQKKVLNQHNQAMKTEITWGFFGGVINLGNRHFQVVP